VPAAGSGTRMLERTLSNAAFGITCPEQQNIPKQYLSLNGVPILQRTLETLLKVSDVQRIVVVLSEYDTHWKDIELSQHNKVETVIGGANRVDSVMAGVSHVCDTASGDAMALVHDAARCLTAASDIEKLIQVVQGKPEQGGLLAVRVQDTIKRACYDPATNSGQAAVQETLPREYLWQAQTPQLFNAKALMSALSLQSTEAIFTDEASAMERSGFLPALVESSQPNFKITRADDLAMAEAWLVNMERNKGQAK